GQRSPAWKKIKPNRVLPCLIVGYRAGRARLHSVLVASLHEQVLRYAGEVSRGFTEQMRAELVKQLSARPRAYPVLPCPKPALWAEPSFIAGCAFRNGPRTDGFGIRCSTVASRRPCPFCLMFALKNTSDLLGIRLSWPSRSR